jgi:peroxiredoxin
MSIMQTKLKTLFLVSLFCGISIFAQTVKITVSNAPSKAVLLYLEGEKAHNIDSVISRNNVFTFSLKDKHNGFYRLQFNKRSWVDFVNDGEDVEMKTNLRNIVDSLKIIKSESNKLYYRFVKLNKTYKTKTQLLSLVLRNYPKDDDYYETTKEKLEEVEYNYLMFTRVESQRNPQSFISRYIRSAQLPQLDGTLSYAEQVEYLKLHSLDNVDFHDGGLTYSDLFTNKSIEYLSYYRNNQMPKALLEKEFTKAVDTLLNKAKVNDLVYQQITEYLIDGFTKFGFDSIINYIVDNYVIKDDICLNEKVESSIQKRIDQAKYLRIGTTAPNIILPDMNGKKVDLSKIKSDKILIIFYSSRCPHCREIVPKIYNLYRSKNNKEFEVVAVSLDQKRADCVKFIKRNNLKWVNVSELKGWNGKTALDYYVYATPTMFLIDSNKKIIAKPITFEGLLKALEDY